MIVRRDVNALAASAFCAQITGKTRIVRHKDAEPAVVDEVRLLGSDARAVDLQTVSIKMRYNRNPVVGDKFSSRHGQKGVLSFLWPQAVRRRCGCGAAACFVEPPPVLRCTDANRARVHTRRTCRSASLVCPLTLSSTRTRSLRA